MGKPLTISGLSRESGVNLETIRFYERSELLPKPKRSASGYRHYQDADIRRLRFIRRGRELGFSLEEIRRLLPDANPQGWAHEQMLGSLQRKVVEIEAMQQRLAQNKAQLLTIIASIESKPEGMPCTENAERVMAQLRGA